MYGLVNAAIQDLVCSNFGADKWLKIIKKAGVEVDTFSRMSSYPDDVTYRLIGAASEVLEIPADDVVKSFGRFWVLFTGKSGYGQLFDMAGNSLRDFLFNLDNLHTRVGQNFPELRPPSFSFEEIDGGLLRMHYYSERSGLCPMIFGLLEGLSAHFKTAIEVEHPICQRQGADHCEFLLNMADAHG